MGLPQERRERHDAWFSGGGVRHAISMTIARANRVLDAFPPFRAIYRRQLFRTVEWTPIELGVGPEHAGLAGLTAVFLSDLHAGSYLGESDLERLFEAVTSRRPDLVLFGGDLVHTRQWEIGMFDRPLRRLTPPLGVFAVPGNHERFPGLSVAGWCARLAEAGVRVLCNDGTRVERGGSSLWLAGVDDLAEGEPELGPALAGRRAGEPTLLLSHHPDLFLEIARRGVDLTLAGHTHGGQIAPFGFVPVRHSEHGLHRGLHSRGGSHLYVGRGVGAAILPLRIGARPEVPVVTITGASRGTVEVVRRAHGTVGRS